jgi:hypothetical protein
MDLSFTVPRNAPNPPYERLDRVMGHSEPSSSPTPSATPGQAEEKKSGGVPIGPIVGVVVFLLVIGLAVAVALAKRQPPGGGSSGDRTPTADRT